MWSDLLKEIRSEGASDARCHSEARLTSSISSCSDPGQGVLTFSPPLLPSIEAMTRSGLGSSRITILWGPQCALSSRVKYSRVRATADCRNKAETGSRYSQLAITDQMCWARPPIPVRSRSGRLRSATRCTRL